MKTRHPVRTVVLIVLGVLVVIIVAAALGTAAKKNGNAAASATTPAATPAGQTTPAAAKKATPPAGKVLIRFNGNGIRNSAPFDVGSGPLTVRYSFNCASFGQSGNFSADLNYGNQASLNSDDQPIANALAVHGSQTTTVYPADPGKAYYLSVDSECSWKIKVSS